MIAKSPNVLFRDLYDLQRAGVVVDTRLILDDGELAIHWSLLDLYGHQCWTGLGEAGGDNVVILPGVSVPEAQQNPWVQCSQAEITQVYLPLELSYSCQ